MGKVTRKRSQIPLALSRIDVKAVLRSRGVYLRLRENQRLKLQAKELATAIIKNKALKAAHKKEVLLPVAQKYASISNQAAASHFKKHTRNIKIIEGHFDTALMRIFDKVKSIALDSIDRVAAEHKSEKSQAKALNEWAKKQVLTDEQQTDLSDEAQLSLTPLLENMGVIAGQDAMKLAGFEDPYIMSISLRARVSANVAKFADSMLQTDQDMLTNMITDGIQNGDSVAQIRSSITNPDTGFAQFSKNQAQTISRTEVARASTQSTLDAFAQTGVVDGIQWQVDGAPCEECIAASQDGAVLPLDGNFYDPESVFQDGTPPLHPNCMCALLPVLAEGDTSLAGDEYYTDN